jgi:hypothetical protein
MKNAKSPSPFPPPMQVPRRLRRWLTGPRSDPSIRVRFWTEVDGRSREDPRVRAAQKEIGKTGWAASWLNFQWPDGHWVTPGTSGRDLYRPKYVVTNWLAIVLADLGMTRSDPRIRRTAELILDRWSKRGGDLSGKSGEICVTGNAVRTLVRFGYLEHPAVQRSIAWIVRTQKSDGGWHCFRSRTGTLDGWEGLAALAEIPEEARDATVLRSIERGAEFYLQHHLTDEGRVSYPPWFRIHYPNHYYYDVLVGLRVLARLGFGADSRMRPALRWLRSKRGRDGTWALDAAHPDLDAARGGYEFRDVVFPLLLEPLHVPSRWATVEALSVLARVGASGA